MKARLLAKKYSALDLTTAVGMTLIACVLIAWGFTFTYSSPKLAQLPLTAGQPAESVLNLLGEPKSTHTSQEFEKIISNPKLDWAPKPESRYECDEVWYYELAPNRFAFLFFKDGKVNEIYLGSS